MNIHQMEIFQGNEIEILEMLLKNVDEHLELSWKIYFEKVIYRITFYNVSRVKVRELSSPVVVWGFEIIDHSQNDWEKDSKYEIRDFEDDCINFFCESFEINEENN